MGDTAYAEEVNKHARFEVLAAVLLIFLVLMLV
jgi:hypothetical protein